MTRLVLVIAVCLAIATSVSATTSFCNSRSRTFQAEPESPPAPPPRDDSARLAKERVKNRLAYEGARDRLRKEVPSGAFVVIVNGEVHSPHESLKDAASFAHRASPDALHRYLYRPGIDDVEDAVRLSPFILQGSDDKCWMQYGDSLLTTLEIAQMASAHDLIWSRRGKRVAWSGEAPRAPLNLRAYQSDDAALESAPAIAVNAIGSALLQSTLTIPERVGKLLDLDRHAIPGKRTIQFSEQRLVECRVGWAEISVVELGLLEPIPVVELPLSELGKK